MNPKNIFGVDLAEQMQRDGHEIPLILIKCCEAIEQNGKILNFKIHNLFCLLNAIFYQEDYKVKVFIVFRE
jgi:hypothetical protein